MTRHRPRPQGPWMRGGNSIMQRQAARVRAGSRTNGPATRNGWQPGPTRRRSGPSDGRELESEQSESDGLSPFPSPWKGSDGANRGNPRGDARGAPGRPPSGTLRKPGRGQARSRGRISDASGPCAFPIPRWATTIPRRRHYKKYLRQLSPRIAPNSMTPEEPPEKDRSIWFCLSLFQTALALPRVRPALRLAAAASHHDIGDGCSRDAAGQCGCHHLPGRTRWHLLCGA